MRQPFRQFEPELISFYVMQGVDPNNIDAPVELAKGVYFTNVSIFDGESILTLLTHSPDIKNRQKLVQPVIASGVLLDHKIRWGEWKGYTVPQKIKQTLEEFKTKGNAIGFSNTQQLRQAIIKACDEKKKYINQALDEHVMPDVRNIIQAYTETSYEELENQDMTELRRSYDAEMKRQADEDEAAEDAAALYTY